MTKKETEKVKKALDLLMDDECDFCQAIHILCELVGWKYPQYKALKKAKSISLRDFIKQQH